METITPEAIYSIVTDTLSEEKGAIVMTLAEKLRNEGLKQGLEQGLRNGLFEGIEFAVSMKFGDQSNCDPAIELIKSIRDIHRLKAVKEYIKQANSLPELIRLINH